LTRPPGKGGRRRWARKGPGPSSPGPPGREQTAVLLGAFCFFLSTLEYLIPKPLPFLRIGLANLPLILGVDLLSPRYFALLALIKILGQGLITGTLFSYIFLFSLAGTLASGAIMYLLRRGLGPARIGFIGISVAGALASNALQLVLARFFILGEGVRLIVPPFLMAGLLTGVALGLFCGIFASRSRWYRNLASPPSPAGPALSGPAEAPSPEPPRGAAFPGIVRFPPGDCFIAGLVMAAAFLLTPSTLGRLIQAALFGFYAGLSGKKPKSLLSLVTVLTIVFFNLLVPYGRVLAEFGPLRITEGSLFGGLRKAITLEGLIFLSRAAIRPGLRLPGRIGRYLGASFRTFEALTERKGLITRKGFVEGIDRLLLDLQGGSGLPPEGGAIRTRGGPLLLAGAALLPLLAGLIPG
jgi:heptaprenyl diphosphate synthase